MEYNASEIRMSENHRHNRIPFGLDSDDERIVDVVDVPRGAKCGCVCPSCRTPLVARQGDEKEWHFAHISRRVYESTKNACQYSFYISVRLMARQLIGDEITLRLPAYRGTVTRHDDRRGYPLSESFLVTEPKEVVISNVEVETRFAGVPVDIVGQINNFRFVVYFTHPGRSVPPELESTHDDRSGVIAISLDALQKTMFSKKTDRRGSYKTALIEFLTNDLSSKQWIYHPRYQRCHQQALQKLEAKAASAAASRIARGPQRSTPSNAHGLHEFDASTSPRKADGRRVLFECVVCNSQWEGWEPSGSTCPRCDTHLYRTIKKVLGDTTSE